VIIRTVDATLVVVPMRRALGTSAARVTEAPLMLIDLTTTDGVVGRAYLFCYLEAAGHAAVALTRDMNNVLAGTSASPAAVQAALNQRFRLLGVRGLVAAVMAAVDVACWDALAQSTGLPLARLLGAELRPIPAYNSNGLGLIEPQAAAAEAAELVNEGFRAMKMRLGRLSGTEDLAAVRAVRAALPPEVAVMADFNQALTPADAAERCRMLDDEGLAWIEEPVRHDDYAASAALAGWSGMRKQSSATGSAADQDVDRLRGLMTGPASAWARIAARKVSCDALTCACINRAASSGSPALIASRI
jgi:mandelate racemase